MTFDDFWKQVKGLPGTASMDIPSLLSDKTKRKLARISPEEVLQIISDAINKINRGSIETIDALIQRSLQK